MEIRIILDYKYNANLILIYLYMYILYIYNKVLFLLQFIEKLHYTLTNQEVLEHESSKFIFLPKCTDFG